jgi:FtsH-binding integral membrane protein
MMLGLLLTAGAALMTVTTPFRNLVFSNVFVFYGLMIAELALVVTLSAAIQKLSPAVAGVLFFTYAVLNGITLSSIFLLYELGSIGMAFFVASALFGAMSLIGYSTKKSLTHWRSYLLMGLIGLLIASVVNIFFASSGLDWMISIIGVLLFLGLTIYDTQRIKMMTAQSLQMGDEAVTAKMGILGALRLYLDFVNIFLYLLRFMGRRRR